MAQRLRRYRSDRELSRCGTFDGETFYSLWHQGLGGGMEWLRLSLIGAEGAVVRVWASDCPEDDPAGPVLTQSGTDLLLYGVRGRYLRFSVSPGERLQGYELAFPGLSLDVGLPAAMRGEDGLRRFLGVYQSLSMDLAREYARFPRRLDPLGQEPLGSLYCWQGADWAVRAPEGVRDKLVAVAALLNRLRGTRRGLELLLKLTAGGRGVIVEGFQWEKLPLSAGERAECARLYGTGVALLLSKRLPKETVQFLEDVLPEFVPAGVSCAVRVLEDGAAMDGLYFLDGNACLVEPPPPVLDESDLDDLILE